MQKGIDMSNNTNKAKAIRINDNLKVSANLLKDVKGILETTQRYVGGAPVAKPAPVAAVMPAPVAKPAPVVNSVAAEPAEVKAESTRNIAQEAEEMASAITTLGSSLLALVKDAAGASVVIAEAGGLNQADRRDATLRRQQQLERIGAMIAGEVSAIWSAAKPTVHTAVVWAAEQALAEEKAEAAQDAEIEHLRHKRAVAQLVAEIEEEREAAEHEREVKRLKRKLELKELRAKLEA